jgi:hypothetical protein
MRVRLIGYGPRSRFTRDHHRQQARVLRVRQLALLLCERSYALRAPDLCELGTLEVVEPSSCRLWLGSQSPRQIVPTLHDRGSNRRASSQFT